MNKCPKCGRYMISHMEYLFGGARCVWTCICGYSIKECTSGMSIDNKSYIKNPKIIKCVVKPLALAMGI